MLSIKNLNFSFSPQIRVLKNLDFQIEKGEFTAILGESGSGKSSLLKLIYGLEDADLGEIYFQNEIIRGPKFNLIPGHPKMKFVPQEFDLLDYVTVAENVGKYLSNFNLPLKKENIENALDVVRLLDFKNDFPNQLSGGQRQRVSIARALAANPELLLLDEPYSHLDQPLKIEIRKSIRNWAKETNSTLIITTHDMQDALEYSDKIIILKDGEIIQTDTPENLRKNPANEYVAALLGEYSIITAKEMSNLFQIEIPIDKKAIVFPDEIEVSEEGSEFEIKDLRFQGRDYLVEAVNESLSLKFYLVHFPSNELIKLKIRNYRLV